MDCRCDSTVGPRRIRDTRPLAQPLPFMHVPEHLPVSAVQPLCLPYKHRIYRLVPGSWVNTWCLSLTVPSLFVSLSLSCRAQPPTDLVDCLVHSFNRLVFNIGFYNLAPFASPQPMPPLMISSCWDGPIFLRWCFRSVLASRRQPRGTLQGCSQQMSRMIPPTNLVDLELASTKVDAP